MRELFSPIELDFHDDKKFSSRFYVLTKDEPKATSLLTPDLRAKLLNCDITDFNLEVRDNILLMNNKKVLCDETIALVDFVYSISPNNA